MAEMRKRISYITDLAPTPAGGGAYAVNWHAFDQLSRRFDARYGGPIVPRLPVIADAVSKFRRRMLKVPGSYTYFSDATLDDNARRASRYFNRADAIFFRSSGRWCHCRPAVPYFVYLDVVVHTFFHNTFSESDFDRKDLGRIWKQEAQFLENASGVFFESEWGMRAAIDAYALTGDHFSVAGIGGVVPPPPADTWNTESRALVTMAMNFRQKGGDIVADAFRELKLEFPSLAWNIIGGQPDPGVLSIDDVTYEGVLNPSVKDDAERLTSILSNAFALVHPTREDTNPLVIAEAAYFGCPAVSVKKFAIPELVVDGTTGILVEPPPDKDSLANAIRILLTDDARYKSMRASAREHALSRFQWDTVGVRICDGITSVIGA